MKEHLDEIKNFFSDKKRIFAAGALAGLTIFGGAVGANSDCENSDDCELDYDPFSTENSGPYCVWSDIESPILWQNWEVTPENLTPKLNDNGNGIWLDLNNNDRIDIGELLTGYELNEGNTVKCYIPEVIDENNYFSLEYHGNNLEEKYLKELFGDKFIKTIEKCNSKSPCLNGLDIVPYDYNGETKYAVLKKGASERKLNIVYNNDGETKKYAIPYQDFDDDGLPSKYQLNTVIDWALGLNDSKGALWKTVDDTIYVKVYPEGSPEAEYASKAVEMLKEYTGE